MAKTGNAEKPTLEEADAADPAAAAGLANLEIKIQNNTFRI